MQTVRETKYSTEIEQIVLQLGHATNSEIAMSLRVSFPNVSDTTVHRVTSRLSDRGVIAQAPKDASGSVRFDANTQPHDHFICDCCGRIRDIDIAKECLPRIEKELGGCKVTGRLVINGTCEKCFVNGGMK